MPVQVIDAYGGRRRPVYVGERRRRDDDRGIEMLLAMLMGGFDRFSQNQQFQQNLALMREQMQAQESQFGRRLAFEKGEGAAGRKHDVGQLLAQLASSGMIAKMGTDTQRYIADLMHGGLEDFRRAQTDILGQQGEMLEKGYESDVATRWFMRQEGDIDAEVAALAGRLGKETAAGMLQTKPIGDAVIDVNRVLDEMIAFQESPYQTKKPPIERWLGAKTPLAHIRERLGPIREAYRSDNPYMAGEAARAFGEVADKLRLLDPEGRAKLWWGDEWQGARDLSVELRDLAYGDAGITKIRRLDQIMDIDAATRALSRRRRGEAMDVMERVAPMKDPEIYRKLGLPGTQQPIQVQPEATTPISPEPIRLGPDAFRDPRVPPTGQGAMLDVANPYVNSIAEELAMREMARRGLMDAGFLGAVA